MESAEKNAADIDDKTIEDEIPVANVYEDFVSCNPVKRIGRELTFDLESTQKIST